MVYRIVLTIYSIKDLFFQKKKTPNSLKLLASMYINNEFSKSYNL